MLSLAWAIAQLGWVIGPSVMIFFSLITWYTSSLLAECYRIGDPHYGKRNYTFMEAVHTILGKSLYTNILTHIQLIAVWFPIERFKVVEL